MHKAGATDRQGVSVGILIELLQFLKERKKWWLAPIIIFLLLTGLLIALTSGTAVAPFIYTLF